jgi:uncharacterized membrane protein (UPF0127 family)
VTKQTRISKGETPVCVAKVADSIVSRGVGLLGRRGLAPDEGLHIKPCTSVHTFFMLFTIDVVFLNAASEIVKCTTMPPFRFALGGKGAKTVLELPAGSISNLSLVKGDALRFYPMDAPGN